MTQSTVANVDFPLSPKTVADELAHWIESIQPDAFVTILLPITDESRSRLHKFYLQLWTRQAEAALWGASARRVRNVADRVLWLFVKEISAAGMVHWHAACRLPERPMRSERDHGMLTLADRCVLLQRTLIEFSRRTPQPYRQNTPSVAAQQQVERYANNGSSLLHDVRGADILAIPFAHPDHANYMVKQRPLTRDNGDELLILP